MKKKPRKTTQEIVAETVEAKRETLEYADLTIDDVEVIECKLGDERYVALLNFALMEAGIKYLAYNGYPSGKAMIMMRKSLPEHIAKAKEIINLYTL